jgi:hypothetical protein
MGPFLILSGRARLKFAVASEARVRGVDHSSVVLMWDRKMDQC